MTKAPFGILLAAVVLSGCSGSSSPTSTTPAVDAAHPPEPVPNGQQAAPTDLGAPLLTPSDLGPTWRTAETPPITSGTPAPFAVGPPAIYEVDTDLQTAHWTGTAWTTDQYVEEVATSYRTHPNAVEMVDLQVAQAKGGYHSAQVRGVKVWKYTSKQAGSNRLIWFAVGPLAVNMTISAPASGAPGVVSDRTVVSRAINRLRAHPPSSGTV